jgi:hypothetical protein
MGDAERKVLRDLIAEGFMTEELVAGKVYRTMRAWLEIRLQQVEQHRLQQGQRSPGNRATRRQVAQAVARHERRSPSGRIVLP